MIWQKRGELEGGYIESNRLSYSVVVGMLVSVTTTIMKGARGFCVKKDTKPVSSMSE